MSPRIAPVALLTLTLAAALTACSGATVDPPATTSAPAPTPTPTATPSPTADGAGGISGGDVEDALAERDQFFRDQQFPTDSTELIAITPQQKDFIAQQRASLESQGAEWTPDYETVYLALTADACETSILNGHAVDTTTFTTHIQSSPLVATLVEGLTDEQKQGGVRSLASIMVSGTSFLCPADNPQWQAAYTEVFG